MIAVAKFGIFQSATVRRVRREEVKAELFVKPDGLETCLSCWKEWMAADPDRDLSMKTMRSLAGDGDGRGMDVHEAQQASDFRIGAATDAMINSLSRIQIWAIYRSCSITTAWRFPNADFASVAEEAREELTKKLMKNICTSVLF